LAVEPANQFFRQPFSGSPSSTQRLAGGTGGLRIVTGNRWPRS
jgi:hypothetical protein